MSSYTPGRGSAASTSTLRSGTGAPAGGLGADGDFYIDTAASELYGPKASGAWGSGQSLVGTPGTNGSNGSTVRNGSGVPSSGLGSNGDFYIDTTALRFYGPKAAGAWGSGAPLAPVSMAATGSAASQTGFATDTYLAGSGIVVNPAHLQAGTIYRFVIEIEKTAASTATGQVVVRMGTTGTISDAAIATLALNSAQTASIDRARLEVFVNFNSVGSGTAAVVAAVLIMIHQDTTTGFVSAGGSFMQPTKVTSSGFDSTTVTNIGVSVNGGASAVWTIANVQAELLNLATS